MKKLYRKRFDENNHFWFFVFHENYPFLRFVVDFSTLRSEQVEHFGNGNAIQRRKVRRKRAAAADNYPHSFVTFNSRLYRYEIEFLILQSGGEHASSILILSFAAWSRSYSWKYFKFQRWKRKERISIFSISSFTLRSSKLSTRFIEKYFQINRVKLREFIKECQILPLLSFDKLFIREKKRCLIHQLDSKSYPNTFLFDLVFLKRSLATNHITFSISRHCIDKIGKRTKTKLQKWLSSSLDKTCSPRGCAFVKINWPMDNFALVVFLRRISI